MITCFNNQDTIKQDTIKPKLVIDVDTLIPLPDSILPELSEDTIPPGISQSPVKNGIQDSVPGQSIIDTTSFGKGYETPVRESYDSANIILKIETPVTDTAPFQVADKNIQRQTKDGEALITILKEGEERPLKPIHNDWILGIILIAAFLFSLLKTTSKNMFPELTRYFLFRGIHDHSSRDISSLFNWQSTILNLISFMIFGLFGFCAATWYDIIPEGMPDILVWFILFCFVIVVVTLRHLTCLITGNISGRTELFNEYIINIYHSYRFSSLVLFILVALIVYTVILPPGVYFITGMIVLLVMYFFRIVRLFLIFMRQDISILYLILYLCALEILPVLISLKYFTGLI